MAEKKEVNPEVKKEVKPAAKPEVKKDAKPAAKPEAKKDAKPEVKKDAKPAAKPEAKKEVKPAVKPAPAKKDVKPEEDKVYHISKRKTDRMWYVKAEGSSKALKKFFTQEEAINYAKSVAGNQEGRIVIHKEDGSFRKLSY